MAMYLRNQSIVLSSLVVEILKCAPAVNMKYASIIRVKGICLRVRHSNKIDPVTMSTKTCLSMSQIIFEANTYGDGIPRMLNDYSPLLSIRLFEVCCLAFSVKKHLVVHTLWECFRRP